jgi:hypothetical protein
VKHNDLACKHPFARFATDFLTTLALYNLRTSRTIVDVAGKVHKTVSILERSKAVHDITYKWHRATLASYDREYIKRMESKDYVLHYT